MRVVDTNVAIVANANSPGASEECVLACIQRLKDCMGTGRLVIDDGRWIIREYIDQLKPEGRMGVGSEFLKWVLRNQADTRRCIQVRITPIDDSGTNFKEFPADKKLDRFDPSDKKFVAVALGHPKRPPILQALDSKWWGLKKVLHGHGVVIEFVCEDDIRQIYLRRVKRKKQFRGK